MNRKEAESLVGKQVSAWTAMNGVYIGRLMSISGSPWRGKVAITGVVQPVAIELSRGDRQRRGFRPGETIDVGGSSIQKVESSYPGHATYLEALVAAEVSLREGLSRASSDDRNRGTLERVLGYRRKQIAAEGSPRHGDSVSTPYRLAPNLPMNEVWRHAPEMLATLSPREVELLDWLYSNGTIFGGKKSPNIMLGRGEGKKFVNAGPFPDGDVMRRLARAGWVRLATGAEPDYGNFWLTDAGQKVLRAKNRKSAVG